MRLPAIAAVCAALALAVAVGCSKPKPALDARVEVRNRDVAVQLMITNFEFTPRVGGGNRLDGHVHLRLDNDVEMMAYGPEFVYKNVRPGRHVLVVSLADRNHAPIGIEKKLDFEMP